MATQKETRTRTTRGRVKTIFGKRWRKVKETKTTVKKSGPRAVTEALTMPEKDRLQFFKEKEKTKRFVTGATSSGTVASEAIAPLAASHAISQSKSTGLLQSIDGGLINTGDTRKDDEEDNPEVI